MESRQNTRLVLASGSPRRRELLARAGYRFEVVTSNAPESSSEELEPHELAMGNAARKARAVAAELTGAGDAVVIGADTIVVLDGHVFGKPADEAQAAKTLARLSGRTHQVITGVCLVRGKDEVPFAETTDVTFRRLDAQTIDAYVTTGEPLDKAGAYGIQGKGAALVDHIEGDYDNVVGLPVERLARELDRFTRGEGQ